MSNEFVLYLYSFVGSLSILFGSNFLIRSHKLIVSKILGIHLIIVGYLILASFFLRPENILIQPHLFRTITPFHYALPPLNFLFFWYLFNPNERFNKYLFFLFTPFIFQLLEYTPFYLSSRDNKINELKWVIAKDNLFEFNPDFMWVNPVYHNYLKFLLAVIFFLFTIVYFVRFKKDKKYQNSFKNQLFNFLVIGQLIFRMGLILYSSFLFFYTEIGKVDSPNYILLGEIFNCFYLAIHPYLLDNKTFAEELNLPRMIIQDKSLIYEDVRLNSVVTEIDEYFKESQVFLKSQLTVKMVAKFTGYSHLLISKSIKFKYGINFREYLNKHRISYFEKLLLNPEILSKFPIDTLIKDSGFGARQSFYSTFKKEKGCSPKEYLSSLNRL